MELASVLGSNSTTESKRKKILTVERDDNGASFELRSGGGSSTESKEAGATNIASDEKETLKVRCCFLLLFFCTKKK